MKAFVLEDEVCVSHETDCQVASWVALQLIAVDFRFVMSNFWSNEGESDRVRQGGSSV